MTGEWFFVLGGVILMLSGVLQAVVRPRKPAEHRLLNRGTIWALVCVLVGAGAILVGTGFVQPR
jgi:hypothetical protein